MLLAIGFVAMPAFAADDATGTWKWSSTRGDKTIESSAKLKVEGDKLTGVYIGRNNMETAITNGSFKDNTVKFDVPLEFNGNKFTIKYSGTLSGDTIKGKTSFDREGQSQERDWEAKRAK
jgi:hypothetical protein